jgi:hypothetical protein
LDTGQNWPYPGIAITPIAGQTPRNHETTVVQIWNWIGRIRGATMNSPEPKEQS